MKFTDLITERLILKTFKKSPIARSKKYGIGKEMPSSVTPKSKDIYFHKKYVKSFPIPEDILKTAYEKAKGFKYNTMRWNEVSNVIAFTNSPDFDTANEPTAGDSLTIYPDGKIVKDYNKLIWHHKWQWVKDNYRGFNVKDSIERSKQWVGIEGVPFRSIGHKHIWIKYLDSIGLEL